MKIKLCELNNTSDSKGYSSLGAYCGAVILNPIYLLLWAELYPFKFICKRPDA